MDDFARDEGGRPQRRWPGLYMTRRVSGQVIPTRIGASRENQESPDDDDAASVLDATNLAGIEGLSPPC